MQSRALPPSEPCGYRAFVCLEGPLSEARTLRCRGEPEGDTIPWVVVVQWGWGGGNPPTCPGIPIQFQPQLTPASAFLSVSDLLLQMKTELNWT